MWFVRLAALAVAGLFGGVFVDVFVDVFVGAPAWADRLPSTAATLGRLHSGNVKEMRMGTMAQLHGRSPDIKAYGKVLVDDHDAADTQVVKLAKDEAIVLAANTPPVELGDMPMGAAFDAAFAKAMLRDHEKDIGEVKAAIASTPDKKLKVLLEELLPVLEKHRDIAQQLVDERAKS